MAMETISQDTPFVKDNSLIRVDFINDETPVVSSLDVARHFQKKHKHVLEEIRKIIINTPESFTGPNFRPSEYTDSTGRKLIAYQLTRDGFCLLVMGFTGQAALQWRIRYIQAFNALENAVRENIRTAALEEGIRIQRRQDGLAVTERALGYMRRGLSLNEAAKLCDCNRETLRLRLRRLRTALSAPAKPVQGNLLEAKYA